jgi:lyso-ornithine lipid O-acyltransferase
MTNWREVPIQTDPFGLTGWFLLLLRGVTLALVVYTGLVLLLLVRLIEWPVFGRSRPITPFITQGVCKMAMLILRLPLTVRGAPMHQKGAVVANHSSWLDIFALNAVQRVYFVSKAEVARWPGIGILARTTGTVFIARKSTEAKAQQETFEQRLQAGHKLLFFPEGTSTDALRVLPFKSSLFQAFYTHGLDRVMFIQPVTVVYHAPAGQDPRYYGWWGDMVFATHLLMTLAARRQGRVEVVFHPEVPVDAFTDRKALADYCEKVIRAAHPLAVE